MSPLCPRVGRGDGRGPPVLASGRPSVRNAAFLPPPPPPQPSPKGQPTVLSGGVAVNRKRLEPNRRGRRSTDAGGRQPTADALASRRAVEVQMCPSPAVLLRPGPRGRPGSPPPPPPSCRPSARGVDAAEGGDDGGHARDRAVPQSDLQHSDPDLQSPRGRVRVPSDRGLQDDGRPRPTPHAPCPQPPRLPRGTTECVRLEASAGKPTPPLVPPPPGKCPNGCTPEEEGGVPYRIRKTTAQAERETD